MAVDSDQHDLPEDATSWIAGRRIAIGGRLAGMSQRGAAETLRRCGAVVVDPGSDSVEWLLLGDAQSVPAVRPGVQVVRETDFWQRLGLVDQPDVRRLYTPAMLADLVGVPAAAIRRWHRQGTLVATQCIHRLPYFDFTEVAIAGKLAALAEAGCSLSMIDRRLQRLAALLPDVERPLADPRVVVDDRRLYLRRGDDLAEPGGQLLLDFDARSADASPEAVLSFEATSSDLPDDLLARLRRAALDYEEQGALEEAIEAYRSILAAGGPSAEIHFALADVLYRQGDLTAARERFYAAIELDEQYVEARFSLGCVLAETGELELAAAALQGTLAVHADYADAHFHLARVLEQLGRPGEATEQYQMFLALSPESPWATAARARLRTAASASPHPVAGGG